jgi:hypothetical protein
MAGEGYAILSGTKIWNKVFLGFGLTGVKQISDDQAALQFEKVSFLPKKEFGRGVKFLSIFMSHSEKNIIKNKMANQRKEN